MSTRKKPKNLIQRLFRRSWRLLDTFLKVVANGVLRSLMVHKRRSRLKQQAGFVLPTVVMVLLVVVLLTTAIVIRSFDRTKNASNFRVDQAVLNAATPALDRARAKIEYLFSPDEIALSGNTPAEGEATTSDNATAGSITNVLGKPKYTFGDETQLKLVYTNPNPVSGETAKQSLDTAWKFPVDTDNNGKYDTFTLYGIYFRNPPTNQAGQAARARTPLEARALPQATGELGTCQSSSASSDQQGWYETDGQLKKAFFVYVANVPIVQADINKVPAANQAKYEQYAGNKGFSALEMQEDQARIALDNNAVWFDDDLAIGNVPTFRLNGRIHTNSNLMTYNNDGSSQIIFYQVSSKDSCYYLPENGQITVGGNVAAGDITQTQNKSNDQVQVHLYKGYGVDPTSSAVSIKGTTSTTTAIPQDLASNSGAFDKRLALLVKGAFYLHDRNNFPNQTVTDTNPAPTVTSVQNTANRFPKEVVDNFIKKYDSTDPGSARKILNRVLTSYFASRIRRVSYKEIPLVGANSEPLTATPGGTLLTESTVFSGSGTLAPPVGWMNSATSTREPDPNINLNLAQLQATNPDAPALGAGKNRKDNYIGDRVLVGNALPTRWLKSTTPDTANGNNEPYTYAAKKDPQTIDSSSVNWTQGGGNKQRWTRVQQLDDLGDTSRGGFWEQAAAYTGSAAKQYPELAGGLRVITGAGIYIDGQEPTGGSGTGKRLGDTTAIGPNSTRSFLPAPPTVLQLIQKSQQDVNGVKLPPEILTDYQANPTLSLNDKYQVVWPDTMPMFQWENPTGNLQADIAAGKIKRGDLQMRATVVYHYKDKATAKSQGIQQEPVACISTFYDPTSSVTAQNFPNGLSLNGINYSSYSQLAGWRTQADNPVLQRQANMIFPDGRWANKPLRDALTHMRAVGGDVSKLSVNEIASIDAAYCALSIFWQQASPATNPLVPDGAIKELAFLDARQIKAIHKRVTGKNGQPLADIDPTTGLAAVASPTVTRNTLLRHITDPDKLKIAELGSLTSEYSLPIEQRQPLEIRVTQINLGDDTQRGIRKKTIGSNTGGTGTGNNQEYMLPNSGIIYASRDDAMPDISDTVTSAGYGQDQGGSATDFKLDPTRRPNGIMLINGENLARVDSYRTAEKGLILASDLPVYIKGTFNFHYKAGSKTRVEEFKPPLLNQSDYSNFYNDRNQQDDDFACRPNTSNSQDKCTVGDQWRPARILSDAVTLLSSDFREGYRNEGDFDLNNNAGNLAVESRLKNGFWWNDFATTTDWNDANGWPKDFDAATTGTKEGSSYLTNGVTPIQRRALFAEYLMEGCTKRPVSACGPQDWVIAKSLNGAQELKYSDVWGAQAPLTTALNTITFDNNPTANPDYVQNNAGTTVKPPKLNFLVAPRRVAFKRDKNGALVPQGFNCTGAAANNEGDTCEATPVGVNTTVTQEVPYDGTALTLPKVNNALWYWTTTDNNQPSTVPNPAITYNNNNKLFYLPFDTENVSERQFLLPGFPEFPQVGNPSALPASTINGNTAFNGPDYALLSAAGTNCVVSKAYQAIEGANVVPCASIPTPTNPAEGVGLAVYELWQKLRSYPSTGSIAGVVNVQPFTIPAPTAGVALTPVTLLAKAKVNIYDLPAGTTPNPPTNAILSNLVITLDRNGQDDPIFVLRASGTTKIIDIQSTVKVKLKGVDPNNIFWIAEEGVRIVDMPAPNDQELVGNFIGGLGGTATSADAFVIARNDAAKTRIPASETLNAPIIRGGRILGFNKTYDGVSTGIPKLTMLAMTTTSQPLLVPVLQLHSAEGTPATDVNTAFGDGKINDKWMQHVTTATTTYNAVLIMGDTPSRPFTGSTANPGETGGGLGNFPRFLEAWEIEGADQQTVDPANRKNSEIKGSFIEFKKSIFATAPFEATDDPTKDNSLFFDAPVNSPPTGTPDYIANFPGGLFTYKGGAQGRKAPYYRPPNRYWGYDVGLLKQTPDLFARRFANPTVGRPNEYFREVSRDDKWIQTLLCAAQKSAANTYSDWAIFDPKQRPGSCQSASPGADYAS